MSVQQVQTPSQLFHQAQSLTIQGYLSQSIRIYQNILSLNSSPNHSLTPVLHYDCLINLSTIYMQQNSLNQAKQVLHRAITLNPQRYQAFYNLSITNFYSKSSFTQSAQCLKHCLSLLYLQLGILTGSLKLLNKSISLCDRNSKAYIHRALYYENNQKIILASNEFEKLTFQHDEYQFTHAVLTQVYLQTTLFFRRIGNKQKMQENLILYHKHKEETKREQEALPQKIAKLLHGQIRKDTLNSTEQAQLKQKITQMVSQVQQLIKQITQEKTTKQQPIPIQNNIQQIIEPPLQKAPIIQTPQSQTHLEPKEQESLLDEEASFPSHQSLPHHDQNPSISFNQDQDSAILNQKIQELQRQIKESGGNVPEIKDLSRNSDEQNFLELEIEKTIEEINHQKQQEKSKLKQTAQKLQQSGKSGISEGKNSSNGDIRDNISMRSKLTQAYEIDLEEMKSYKTFNLQIRSVTMFEQNTPRKDSFAKVNYFTNELLTEKCKNDKLTWNHKFEQIRIKHSTLEDYDDEESKYELNIEIHAREGGWLSWNNDVMIGKGAIKLTEKGATKCTLENKGKKVGMLYYKVKLHKFEEEKQ